MNNIIKRIDIDFYSPTPFEVINAQQGDNLSRIIEFVLYDKGEPYTIANNIAIKMEGHRGDNSSFIKDCSVSNNIITAVLDSDILYEAGTVEAKIVMYELSNDSILSTIPFRIYVQKNPCNKNAIEKEKGTVIDWIILKLEKLKTDFEEHINNFLNPHNVTKEQVGLGNAENKSSEDIRSEITNTNVTDALGYTPVSIDDVTPESIGALPLSGGSVTGTLTVNTLVIGNVPSSTVGAIWYE